jgi:hypothetical protein
VSILRRISSAPSCALYSSIAVQLLSCSLSTAAKLYKRGGDTSYETENDAAVTLRKGHS